MTVKTVGEIQETDPDATLIKPEESQGKTDYQELNQVKGTVSVQLDGGGSDSQYDATLLGPFGSAEALSKESVDDLDVQDTYIDSKPEYSQEDDGADDDEDIPAFDERASVIYLLSGAAEPQPGDAIDPTQSPLKYEFKGDLNQGAMGKVLLIRDNDINRDVAMKIIHEHMDSESSLVERFITEIQTTGYLEHPNIIPIHDMGINAAGKVYYTMKFVSGDSLEEIILKLDQGDKEMHRKYSFQRRVQIFLQVCSAITYAHSRGVIHRDLKPENIMIGPFGEVLVMDWGLAKVLNRQEKSEAPIDVSESLDSSQLDNLGSFANVKETVQGAIMGTPMYMSPEQAKGHINQLDGRSDVYSLGAVLYRLLTLKDYLSVKKNINAMVNSVKTETQPNADSLSHPHQRRTPREMTFILNRALQKDPAKRYQSVPDMMAAIQEYLNGTAVYACPVVFSKRGGHAVMRFINNYRIVAVMVLLFLLSMTVYGTAMFLYILLGL